MKNRETIAPPPGSPLSHFSTAALMDELRRRESGLGRRSMIVPCDECQHFKAWVKGTNVPDDYNPCSLGHHMLFRAPANYLDDVWGFYMPGCKDRKRIDQSTTQ